jgi:hypothetical protein
MEIEVEIMNEPSELTIEYINQIVNEFIYNNAQSTPA